MINFYQNFLIKRKANKIQKEIISRLPLLDDNGVFDKGNLVFICGVDSIHNHFAQHILINFGLDKIPCMYFTINSHGEEIAYKLLTMLSHIEYSRLKKGRITDLEFEILQKEMDRVSNFPLELREYSDTVLFLEEESYLQKQNLEQSIKVVFIDNFNAIRTVVGEKKFINVTKYLKKLLKL